MTNESLARTEGGETARRAFRLLEAVASSNRSCSPSELAAMTGLSAGTTYRLARILQEERYLQRGRGGYRVGSRLFGLAAAALPQLAAFDAALPLMSSLAAYTGEMVGLHRRLGDSSILLLVQESTRYELRRVGAVGTAALLTRSPNGQAMLAHLPDPQRNEIVSRSVPADQVTESLDRLKEAHERGWAFGDEANHPGVSGLAALLPLPPDPANAVAISVTGPGERVTLAAAETIAPIMRETSAQIAKVIRAVRES